MKNLVLGAGLIGTHLADLLKERGGDVRILSRSGLVHSMRGLRGGYALNRPATEITLGEIVRALGTVETTEHICTSFTGNRDACIHFSNCGIRSVWSGLTTYIQSFMDQTTLASLLEPEYTVSERLANRPVR
mgnify:CR=1 FL=1